MMQITKHDTTAAAKVQFRADSRAVMVGAAGLAGAEACPLYVRVGEVWQPVTDMAGDAQSLTAGNPTRVLDGGPAYAVDKPTTTGPASVYVEHLL